MRIFQKAADIVNANLNDLVDRFENPQRLLRQALREMDDTIAATSAAVARSLAAERLLVKTRDEHAAQIASWQARSLTAIGTGDDELARRAVARKLDHQRAVERLDLQLAAAGETNERLREQLDLLRQKHSDARSRLLLLDARQRVAVALRQATDSWAAAGSQSRAFARFERYFQQLEFADAEAEAYLELASSDLTLESEFDRRDFQQRVEQELARLKSGSAPT